MPGYHYERATSRRVGTGEAIQHGNEGALRGDSSIVSCVNFHTRALSIDMEVWRAQSNKENAVSTGEYYDQQSARIVIFILYNFRQGCAKNYDNWTKKYIKNHNQKMMLLIIRRMMMLMTAKRVLNMILNIQMIIINKMIMIIDCYKFSY